MANEAQKSFLLDIGCRNLPDEDSIVWFVENILTDLAEDEREMLKAKYGLAGGYRGYTFKELAAIFQLTVAEFRSTLRGAREAAGIAMRNLRGGKTK
jgi:DNA-directed RNA polymerase sigma subunit (sigma70/sigma32)